MFEGNSALQTVMDATPNIMFVVDRDGCIAYYNAAGRAILGEGHEMMLRKRGGEALNCVNASKVPEGCGHADACRTCVIRNSVGRAYVGNSTVRQRTRMTLVGSAPRDVVLLITASPLEYEDNRYVLLALEDISEYSELREIIPICCQCKKIRNDDQYWDVVESYIHKYTDADLTHSYCPDCAEEVIAWIKATPQPTDSP